jgi:CubicO group peptidase (beta-lactamase class C family)
MTLKTPTGELVPTDPVWKQNLKDDLGGGGLYSTPSDYVKLLIALLKKDETLLQPETVAMMFQPQLADDKYINDVVNASPMGPMFTNGLTECKKWNFGLGGILNLEDVLGVANKGAMAWGGLPNLFWWIDPTGGHCGLYASQLMPPGDERLIKLALEFRKGLWDIAPAAA